MSWMFERLRLSVFGESHGKAIGAVIEGLPAGEAVDLEAIKCCMERRKGKSAAVSTTRGESDEVEILSGLYRGKTTGTPLALQIVNRTQRSEDYDLTVFRPSHADYTAQIRYGGNADMRGGGHFSGRLTAPLVAAGAIAKQILGRRAIEVEAFVSSVGAVKGLTYESVSDPTEIAARRTEVVGALDDESAMLAVIRAAREQGDSVGGTVDCVAAGLPAGYGDPLWYGVESRLAAMLFGIPAVKGVEFGRGFGLAEMRGSEANDPFVLREGRVVTTSNRSGGINGGITNGMPLTFRTAFRPTPTIFVPQKTVTAEGRETEFSVKGRHDGCIVPRAAVVVECAAALILLDLAERYR